VVPAGTASDVVTAHFDLLPGNRTAAGIGLFRNVKSCLTLNTNQNQTAILILIANEEICNYIIELCKNNNYNPIITANPEELIKKIRGMSGAIVFVDQEVVNSYGAKIYSRINVTCSGCDVILLCDQSHRDLIKEAMELSVYACILAPFKEWEVLTMIRNILAKRKREDKTSPTKIKPQNIRAK
jgi:DNA-binding NtrC family response regulator